MPGFFIWPLDPKAYAPHPLHQGRRDWSQSNCYVDLWIEVLHTMQRDPLACCSFSLAVDFEGDQWTFFKPPLSVLEALYGIQVQELNIWDSLCSQTVEQVSRGRLVITEADAFYLPDTAGLSYGVEHTKTAIAIQAIDLEARRAGYFHNGGYYELKDGDFNAVLQRGASPGAQIPYVEFAKLPGEAAFSDSETAIRSAQFARAHVEAGPRRNPFPAFKERFLRDLGWLGSKDLAAFHRYAFATLRQCGAAFELASFYLRWLEARGHTGPEAERAASAFAKIGVDAKAMMFKTARILSAKKGSSADLGATLDAMAANWDAGYLELRRAWSGVRQEG